MNKYFLSLLFSFLLFSCAPNIPSVDNSITKASDLFANGKYLESASILDKIIKAEESSLEPDSSTITGAYIASGKQYELAGLVDSSIKRWETVLNKYPKYVSIIDATDLANNLGTLFRNQDNRKQAIKYYKMSLGIAYELEDIKRIVLSLVLMSNTFEEDRNFSEALESMKLAVSIAESEKDDPYFLPQILGYATISFYKLDKDLVIPTISKKLKIYKSLSNDSLYTQSHVELGNYYTFLAMDNYTNGNYDQAIDLFNKAIPIHKKYNNNKMLQDSYISMLGLVVIRTKNNHNKLSIHIDEIFDFTKTINDEKLKIDFLEYISLYYHQINDTKFVQINALLYDIATKIDDKIKKANIFDRYAGHLSTQGNFALADSIFNESFKIYNELGDSTQIAVNLKLMALNRDLYKSNEAIGLFTRSYNISFAIGDSINASATLSSMGTSLHMLGEYRKAEEAIIKALELDPSNSSAVNNLGLIYSSWGQNHKALVQYKKALEIKDKNNIIDVTAELNNVGNVYEHLGDYDLAIEYYEKSLELTEELGHLNNSFLIINNLIRIYRLNRDFDKIEFYINKSSTGGAGLASLSRGAFEAAMVYFDLSEDEMARDAFHKILKITEPRSGELMGPNPKVRSDTFFQLAYLSFFKSDYDSAIFYMDKSMEITEYLEKQADIITRRDYNASLISSYENIIHYNNKLNNLNGTFAAIENSKARVLKQQLFEETKKVSLPSLPDIQKFLSSKEAIIIYSNIHWDEMIQFVITKDSIVMISVPDSSFLNTLYPDNEDANITLAIKSYRNSIKWLNENEDSKTYSKALYDYLITPLENHIKGKSELLIVPEGILGYLPFESLIDNNNRFLSQSYNIKYMQSLGVLDMINKRPKQEFSREILALGGAVYDERTYEVELIENKKMLNNLIKNTSNNISTRSALSKSYASLGYDSWENLPGTLNEVNLISTIIDNTDIIVGKEVNEKNIYKLSENNSLSKYKIIHFATHGIVIPDIPELSALVLSQFENNPYEEDGYLRMDEIISLNIAAELINLSACETGIGKIYAGEGVVGLTQAFLLAGANSVSVSLWSIDDQATAKFMESFYNNINDGYSYSISLSNTKKDFISGKYGDEYKKPYYWAPFVYYGK